MLKPRAVTALLTAVVATCTVATPASAKPSSTRCQATNFAMQCALRGLKPPKAPTIPKIHVVTYGVDFAWSKIYPSQAPALKIHFGASYLSTDPSKNWSANLVSSYHHAGLSTVAVWETAAQRALGGYAAGRSDALRSVQQVAADGFPSDQPVYFACDWDETSSQASTVASYFQGVASVIGVRRTGAYGGYWTVKRLFDAGLIHYGWQTYAWSGGLWDSRAQLEQYLNGSSFDWDRAIVANYGQSGSPTPGPTPGPTPRPTPGPTPGPTPTSWPLVKQGSTGRNAVSVQYLLDAHGYLLAVDGIDGPATTSVVRDFQRTHALGIDGLVGPLTWHALIITVSNGAHGPAVKAEQSQLDAHGNRLVVDGAFGPATGSATRAYQHQHKLVADGVAGPLTWNALTK